MVTLNNVLGALSQIATNHRQINSYGTGELYDIVTSGDINYPLMYTVLENSQIGQRVEALTFTILIMDIVKGGRVNEDDVQSDTLEIVKDIIAQLHHPSYSWSFENDLVTVDPFVERFTDSVTGFSFQVTLLLPFAYDRCAMPYTPTSIISSETVAPTTSFFILQELTIVSGLAPGTSFTFNAAPLQVYLNGQLLRSGVGYTVSGNSIEILTTIFEGDLIWAYGNY